MPDDFQDASKAFHASIHQQAQLEMMRSPHRWPRRPFLCLRHRTKRLHGLPEPGLMVDPGHPMFTDHRFTVFAVNLYDIPAFGGTMTMEEFIACGYRYPSYTAILHAGWEVD